MNILQTHRRIGLALVLAGFLAVPAAAPAVASPADRPGHFLDKGERQGKQARRQAHRRAERRAGKAHHNPRRALRQAHRQHRQQVQSSHRRHRRQVQNAHRQHRRQVQEIHQGHRRQVRQGPRQVHRRQVHRQIREIHQEHRSQIRQGPRNLHQAHRQHRRQIQNLHREHRQQVRQLFDGPPRPHQHARRIQQRVRSHAWAPEPRYRPGYQHRHRAVASVYPQRRGYVHRPRPHGRSAVFAVDGYLQDDGYQCVQLRDDQGNPYVLEGLVEGLFAGDHVRLVAREAPYSSCGGYGRPVLVTRVTRVWADAHHRSAYYQANIDGSFAGYVRWRRGDDWLREPQFYDPWNDGFEDDYYYDDGY